MRRAAPRRCIGRKALAALALAGLTASRAACPQNIDAGSPEHPPPAAGIHRGLVGKWGAVTIFSDDGKTAHGVGHGSGRVYALDGIYVAPDQLEFTAVLFAPGGCQTSSLAHWRLLGDDQIEARFDGWNGCGLQTGAVQSVIAKSAEPPIDFRPLLDFVRN